MMRSGQRVPRQMGENLCIV